MADDSMELTVGDNSLELDVNPPYVGSAFSPEVDIEETTSTITVTITDARGEHSYSVPNTESAIADAEAATAAATSAASVATSAASAAGTATTAANSAASAAVSAASDASDAADLAEEKAGVAVQAASDANSAAEVASAKATLANTAATAANAAASAAGNAASAATSAADYADIATRDASAAADAANSAADAANAAAAAAESATETVDAAVASANAAASYANEKGGAASNAANAANSAASSATSAASAANSAASTASTAATNADNKASAANTAAGAANTAAAAATSAASAANTSAEAANTAAEYASEFTEAYLPMVTAGVSESLLATDVTVDTFAQRTSDHDGACRIASLWGNTVRWNQLLNPQAYANNQATHTTTDGVTTVNANSVTKSYFGLAIVPSSANTIKAGHKYFIRAETTVPDGANNVQFSAPGRTLTTLEGTWIASNGVMEWLFGVTAGDTGSLYINATFSSEIDLTGKMFSFKAENLFDLTAMFGAGNEPQTVAEFERMYPESYYPYDAGSLLSVNIEGIESAGITREIPPSTLFADGILRSAGSAYDERTPTRDVKRVGVVDLGTLTWSQVGTTQRFKALLTGMLIPLSVTADGLTCDSYTPDVGMFYGNPVNMTIARGTDGYVYVVNNDCADAVALKSAMDGVMLYYELATPTEATIDPPLNLAYPVEQGGTESIVVPTGEMSAAPTMAVVYAYNADGVRDLSQAIIATIEGNTASTNYAIGGYFVHAGKLYKATSAIATGETINPGTNCTQTTVMAELVRLTA